MTVEILCAEWQRAKAAEERAKADRVAVELKIAEALPGKPEGSSTHAVPGFKVELTGVINRKMDWTAWSLVRDQIPEEMRPVKSKPELDETGVKWLQTHRPDLYKLLPIELTIMNSLPVRLQDGYRARINWHRDTYAQFYFMDDNVWTIEETGVWTKGDSAADVVMRADRSFTKIQLTVHSDIDNTFVGKLGGQEFTVALQPGTSKTIEFTPGPGSALYGGNALLGVVNIVTRHADTLAGPQGQAALELAVELAEVLDRGEDGLHFGEQLPVERFSGPLGPGADVSGIRAAGDGRGDVGVGEGELQRELGDVHAPGGAVRGGGVGLVAACDIAIAARTATFKLSEVKIGVIPSMISPYVIAAIGARQSRRYMISGAEFDAAEAWRIGLVHDIVEEAELNSAVGGMLAQLYSSGPRAMAAAKRLIDLNACGVIDQRLTDETARRIADIRATPEGQEGLSAFLEKRKPNWVEPKRPAKKKSRKP